MKQEIPEVVERDELRPAMEAFAVAVQPASQISEVRYDPATGLADAWLEAEPLDTPEELVEMELVLDPHTVRQAQAWAQRRNVA